MKFTTAFGLNKRQAFVDFVDIDVVGDVPLFIDPTALRQYSSDWCRECATLLQSFFEEVIRCVKNNEEIRALSLLSQLKEPNEFHLGLSKGAARGRGMGAIKARSLYRALSLSRATSSGLLRDLEDTILMIDGVGIDVISDITCNVIRKLLIDFTKSQIEKMPITNTAPVDSGPLWNPLSLNWYNEITELPVLDDRKFILVPKEIVRRHIEYDPQDYYRNYILEKIKELEFSAKSELVRVLQDGRLRIDKKELEKKYGYSKSMLLEKTLENPEILEQYRREKIRIRRPMDADDFFGVSTDAALKAVDLWQALPSISAGRDEAKKYENEIENICTFLFDPDLTRPIKQSRIHEGRKIIDLEYTNLASGGFWRFLADHYRPCPKIFIECKNYTEDPGNPELDQLSGRFSRDRGMFGILIARNIQDKERMNLLLKDTAKDGRGFMICLDDDDLKTLCIEKDEKGKLFESSLLFQRFDLLIK